MSDKIITLKQTDTGDRLLPKTVKEAILDLEIDQTYDETSANPQSGVAIAGALSDVAFSGSYNDLENKPTIPSAPVQSNWNESDVSSLAYIQNKPTIPAAQVQSDWNETNSASKAYILNKPTIPVVTSSYSASGTDALNGVAINDAGFLRNGTSTTSALSIGNTSSSNYTVTVGKGAQSSNTQATVIGYYATGSGQSSVAVGDHAVANGTSSIQLGAGTNNNANTFQVGGYELLDTSTGIIPDGRISTVIARATDIPTNTNQLTNGAGFITSSDLSGYQLIAQNMSTASASGTISLTDNTIYKLSATGNVTFSLPSVSDTAKLHQIFVQLNMSTARTINVGTTYYFNKTAPDLSAAGTYNLYWEYDNTASYWVCGCISKGASS